MGNALTNPDNLKPLGVIDGKRVELCATRFGNFVNVEGEAGSVSVAWLVERDGLPVHAQYKTEFWDAVRAALALQGYGWRE